MTRLAVAELAPLTTTCLRFGLGALLLLAVLIWRGEIRSLPSRRDWLPLLVLGALGVTAFGALHTIGLQWTGAAEGALIQGMSPLLTLLLAALLVGEPIRRGQMLGGLTAFAGLAVLLLGGTAAWGGGADRLLGDLVLVGGCLCWTGYNVSVRLTAGRLRLGESSAYALLVGTLLLVPFALIEPVRVPLAQVEHDDLAGGGLPGARLDLPGVHLVERRDPEDRGRARVHVQLRRAGGGDALGDPVAGRVARPGTTDRRRPDPGRTVRRQRPLSSPDVGQTEPTGVPSARRVGISDGAARHRPSPGLTGGAIHAGYAEHRSLRAQPSEGVVMMMLSKLTIGGAPQATAPRPMRPSRNRAVAHVEDVFAVDVDPDLVLEAADHDAVDAAIGVDRRRGAQPCRGRFAVHASCVSSACPSRAVDARRE